MVTIATLNGYHDDETTDSSCAIDTHDKQARIWTVTLFYIERESQKEVEGLGRHPEIFFTFVEIQNKNNGSHTAFAFFSVSF